jgi:hypothetical protein
MEQTQMKEQEHDPEGLPLSRELPAVRQHDQVTETSPDPLTALPQGAGIVGQSGPNQPEARAVGMEAAKSPASSSIPEYKQPLSRLPNVITARQVYEDDSNPDGRVSGRQR